MLEEQEREGEQRLGLHQLRWMISNAEALPVSLCHQWTQLYPHVRLLNTYGATECSDDISHYVLSQLIGKSWTSVPLGDPIANMQVHILDESMNLVPIGVKGELYLGGTGVGRGYLNRPLVTAQQFVPDPFASRPGARLYRTGDVGRRLRDGSLAFLGRADHQVKIRGHRVELGEIEAALLEHPRVEQAVVLAREDHPSDKRLVAYIVPAKIQQELPPDAGSDQTIANWQKSIGEDLAEVLRPFLVTRLPEYLIPTAWVELEALPLTENGKVDRGALLPPAQKMNLPESFAAPRNELEVMLSDIWSQLLHVPHVGIHDNFFALGGHSLMATQVISRVRSILQKEVPLAAVFRSPTLAGLAAEIQQASHQTRIPGVPQIKVADRQAFRRRPVSV
jgi:acyl-coenzyme A synthetase/AMP-(fatty) acid ligase